MRLGMFIRRFGILRFGAAISLATVCCACGDGAAGVGASASAAPAASVTSSVTASARPRETWCERGGGKGQGTLDEMCAMKAPPFEIRVLDRYADAVDGRLCAIKNTSAEDWTWGGAKGFYYDNEGKLLSIQPTNRSKPLTHFTHSGTGFKVKAGDTFEYECGWQRSDEPAGSTLEVEVYQWGGDTPTERYFTRDLGGKAWDDRPRGGF